MSRKFYLAALIVSAGIIVSYVIVNWSVLNITDPKEKITINDKDSKDVLKEEDLSIDINSYFEIQGIMEKKFSESKPEVLAETLRVYDVDSDGNNDIVGFLRLTWWDGDSADILSTWKGSENGYVYMEDWYNDFRIYADELIKCEITKVGFLNVELVCFHKLNKENVHKIYLKYQDNGVGYYRNVENSFVVFDETKDTSTYVSLSGGVKFKYPKSLIVTENTYEIFGDYITVIKGKRGDSTIFEIHRMKDDGEIDYGGGVIDNSYGAVFLKLLDESILLRKFLWEDAEPEDVGVFYQKIDNLYKKNNVGSIGMTYDTANIVNGNKYDLFTPLLSEEKLSEVDQLFSSLEYFDEKIDSDNVVKSQRNKIILNNAVEINVPGHVESEEIDNPDLLRSIRLNVNFVDSYFYKDSNLYVTLRDFGSVGGTGRLGGGGYSIEGDGCFRFDKDKITEPETIGKNKACFYGAGDAGVGSVGYFVLDPEKRYIVGVFESLEYDPKYKSIDIDLKTIVENVSFSHSD